MRITIIQDDGVVGIDGVFRKVDVSELAGEIRAIQFDTDEGVGHIEYDPGATDEIEVRDHEREAAEAAAAGNDPAKHALLEVRYKRVRVPRQQARITDFSPYQVYVERWVAAAPPPPPPPEPQDPRVVLERAVQQHLDSRAQELGYDNIFTAVTYAEEPSVPKFQAEGRAFREWRSKVWDYCYQVLADVLAGNRGIPTKEELIGELPALVLPD